MRDWGPSRPGKLLTGTPNWRLSLDLDQFALRVDSKCYGGGTLDLEHLHVRPGVLWATVRVPVTGGQFVTLDGIPNGSAGDLAKAVAAAVRHVRVKELLDNFPKYIQPVVEWVRQAREASKAQLNAKGWLTTEFKAAQNRSKPKGLEQLLAQPEVADLLDTQPSDIKDAVRIWKSDFDTLADGMNARHVKKEVQEYKAFFELVEKSPLTEEQAQAVICFDNRVLLVASAGSGKTSTMVAKAGYALKKGYFGADKMLLLAFNKDAAAELRDRIENRLGPLGLPADRVVAKTFHAFGLDVIGQASGKRPSIPAWLESGRDVETLLELVDELKDRDVQFRTHWDLFRVVFGQDLPKFGKEEEAPDSWDKETRKEGFWTLNGEVVKSRGEQMIANWLFYNGVAYLYEAPYPVETADQSHRQYHPDFYLTEIDTYLEHWALDAQGNPPPAFVGYKEGMAWKRALHVQHGTKLLETTMADLWSGKAFQYLSEELPKLGIVLDPNLERTAKGRKPIENTRLARTFRTFLTHVKSNRLSMETLHRRQETGIAGDFGFRHRMFLGLFETIWQSWEARLRRDQCIDFEDMLALASDCIENGQWSSPYELVMVDEFQDVSQARAKLIANLVKQPGRCLFAVGDDWQSINRFAGADLSVMTDFEKTFGRGVILRLEATFRCPQSLCDISSEFVQKNPKQLRKMVRSAKPNVSRPVSIVQVADESGIRSAIAKRVRDIADDYRASGRRPRVYVLGRYNKERELLPLELGGLVDVEFVTAHSSKGLEADHVILPKVTSETLGFPSRVEDDPVLQLAMPGGDSFEYAEERRLFYVALTRARTSVTLITIAHKQSPFIAELVKEHNLAVVDLDGAEISTDLCPICKEGFMVRKDGRYGPFLGCSTYPKCRHTQKIKTRFTDVALTSSRTTPTRRNRARTGR